MWEGLADFTGVIEYIDIFLHFKFLLKGFYHSITNPPGIQPIAKMNCFFHQPLTIGEKNIIIFQSIGV